MTSGIYRIVNQATGRTYIGSSIHMNKRFQTHRRRLSEGTHDNRHLQQSWNKRGMAAFLFEPLLECRMEDLATREQQFIDAYFDHALLLYNQMPCSKSVAGFTYIRSKASREKHAAAIRGRSLSSTHRAKISLGLTGHIVSAETRAKLALANTGKPSSKKGIPVSMETRAKISTALTGRLLPQEHRAKLSAAHKGKPSTSLGLTRSPEIRARLSAAHKGKELSASHRAAVSLGQFRRWAKERANKCS